MNRKMFGVATVANAAFWVLLLILTTVASRR